MKVKKLKPIFRGIAATSAALLTLSTVGYGIAKSELAIGWVDGYFNVDRTIYNDWVEDVPGYTIPGSLEGYSYLKGKQYTKRQNTVVEYAEQLKAHAVKQGEEGFALLKNDNGALPLNKSSAGSNVALFGWNAYNMPSGHTGVVAGRVADRVARRLVARRRSVVKLPPDLCMETADISAPAAIPETGKSSLKEKCVPCASSTSTFIPYSCAIFTIDLRSEQIP